MINYNAYLKFQKENPDEGFDLDMFIALNLVASSPPKELLEDLRFDDICKVLENLQLIKKVGDQVVLRPLGEKFLGLDSHTDNLIKLAEELRELFPKGIKSGGYPVRSSVYDIADKLKKFMKKYSYSNEVILKATKQYLKRKEAENWNFTQIAVYFIEKNGISTLAAECENLVEGSEEFNYSNMEQL